MHQDHNREAQTQREDVLKLLNRRYSKEPLVNVVKDVLKHEQKHRSLVMRDILKLADTLKRVVPGTAASPTAPVVTTTSSGLPDPSTLDTKHFKVRLSVGVLLVFHFLRGGGGGGDGGVCVCVCLWVWVCYSALIDRQVVGF